VFIIPLIVIFSAYSAAILSVGIAVTIELNLALGILAFILVVLFPFFAEKDSCSKLGWMIWNGAVIVCSVSVYGRYSLIIFVVWAFFAWQWRNVNGSNPFTWKEFTKLFSRRRAA